MTNKDYSQSAVLEFLRQSAISGSTKPATARSRKLAAEQLLVQLQPHESNDLRLLDVDELCSRFHKLQGSTIRPETCRPPLSTTSRHPTSSRATVMVFLAKNDCANGGMVGPPADRGIGIMDP